MGEGRILQGVVEVNMIGQGRVQKCRKNEKKGIVTQKEENLWICMNFAVGNVWKHEKLSNFLKYFAKKFAKAIAYLKFIMYNIIKVVESGEK